MQEIGIFIGMVFIAVVLLTYSMIVPVFGEGRRLRQRLQQRLANIDSAGELAGIQSILRQKYLKQLSPWEAWLEELPAMAGLSTTIEQAGHHYRAYRVVLLSILLSLVLASVGWFFSRFWFVALVLGLIGLVAPIGKIRVDRNKRFELFEEQLPDAVDVIRRALLAGHPFNNALKLASEDLAEPVAGEFRTVFADINYGNDARRALFGLLTRVPSITVMALVTSVLVQRETGGNLAEILEQISKVIRSRFRFQRRVKTLSAEGRMSGWVLAMVPLVLFAIISVTTPDYLPVLLSDPTGQIVVAFTFMWACIGILLMRKIIRIEV